jgi:hypothetical protein
VAKDDLKITIKVTKIMMKLKLKIRNTNWKKKQKSLMTLFLLFFKKIIYFKNFYLARQYFGLLKDFLVHPLPCFSSFPSFLGFLVFQVKEKNKMFLILFKYQPKAEE